MSIFPKNFGGEPSMEPPARFPAGERSPSSTHRRRIYPQHKKVNLNVEQSGEYPISVISLAQIIKCTCQ